MFDWNINIGKAVDTLTAAMETDSLILVPIRANDFDSMADFLSDPMLTRSLSKGGSYTGPEIEAYLAAVPENNASLALLRKLGMALDPAFD